MRKIRTPPRTIKVLKIILENQDTGIYKHIICQQLGIQETDVYPNIKHMLEDGLIYLDREVSIGRSLARKYYKICEDKLAFAKYLVKEELRFWNSNNKHVD